MCRLANIFSRRASILALCAATGLVACEQEPPQVDPEFQWQESVTDMRDALLGACTGQGVTYAVGGLSDKGALYRWTSRRWLQEATMLQGPRLWACWAGPREMVLAVGQRGTVWRHSAEGWHRNQIPDEVAQDTLYGVWGLPDGSAVAVGGGSSASAVILHFDGESWSQADTSKIQTRILRDVWGSAADDLWAVGDDGAIAHYNGESWVPGISRVDDRLYGVHGVGPQEVYAVGGIGRGLVLRYNGSSWLPFDEPDNSLRSVWTGPERGLYVGGDSGFVARYDRIGGLPQADRKASRTPFPHLRVFDLIGMGAGVLGTAATMETGEDGDWRGAVVSHKQSFAGPVFESAAPDASIPDASADAGPVDAE